MMVLFAILGLLGATLILMWVPVILWLILDMLQVMLTTFLVAVVVGLQTIKGGSLLGLCMMRLTMTLQVCFTFHEMLMQDNFM